MKTFTIAWLVSLGAVVVTSVLYVWLFASSEASHSTQSIDAYAQQLVQVCEHEGYRPFCYEKEIPKLTSELSTDEIFAVIRAIRQYDPE